MYNQELIGTLADRFDKLQSDFSEFDEVLDLYAFIASIIYDKKYTDCFDDGNPNSQGKELRDRVKQFILPLVVECGGLLDGEEEVQDWPWYKEN